MVGGRQLVCPRGWFFGIYTTSMTARAVSKPTPPMQRFILNTSVALALSGFCGAATLINEYPSGSTSNIVVTASSQINGFNQALYTLTTALSNAEFNPGVLDNATDGQHGSGTRQSWRGNETVLADVANEWIQWDLGTSYQLDSIQVWNYNDSARYESGIRTLDIYVSNVANPGDPEGAGAANWTHWAKINRNSKHFVVKLLNNTIHMYMSAMYSVSV